MVMMICMMTRVTRSIACTCIVIIILDIRITAKIETQVLTSNIGTTVAATAAAAACCRCYYYTTTIILLLLLL